MSSLSVKCMLILIDQMKYENVEELKNILNGFSLYKIYNSYTGLESIVCSRSKDEALNTFIESENYVKQMCNLRKCFVCGEYETAS